MPVKSFNEVTAFQPVFDDDVVEADVLIQAGQTIVTAYNIHNTTAADAFLQMFNAAAIADVTMGTTVPNYVIAVEANGVQHGNFPGGLGFTLGLVVAGTTATGNATGAAIDVSFAIA
jgi:hypothetical protein